LGAETRRNRALGREGKKLRKEKRGTWSSSARNIQDESSWDGHWQKVSYGGKKRDCRIAPLKGKGYRKEKASSIYRSTTKEEEEESGRVVDLTMRGEKQKARVSIL